MLRLLFLGDVVGEPGRNALIRRLRSLQEEKAVDFTVVNGENAAGGRGITGRICIELLRAGAAVVTTGDHVWDQRELPGFIPTEPRLLRPCNYPAGTPGSGSMVLETSKGPVAVLNVRGQTFMQPPLDNPFTRAREEVDKLRAHTPVILVDVHAETTSEKTAMAHWLDGTVSAVAGTHTHVQTADERILPRGTAFICDAGMCGPVDGVIGRAPDPVIERFVGGMPVQFPLAQGAVTLQGVLVEVDPASGRALAVERFREDFCL